MSSPRPLSRHPLLGLALALVLIGCIATSLARLVRRGRGWDVVRAGLLREGDDELLRRALGGDWTRYAALRDHVPPGSRVALVGASDAGAGFYQHVETMLYPVRFVAVPLADMQLWRAGAERPARDVYVLFYDEPSVDPGAGTGLVRVETGSDARLYRWPARAEGE